MSASVLENASDDRSVIICLRGAHLHVQARSVGAVARAYVARLGAVRDRHGAEGRVLHGADAFLGRVLLALLALLGLRLVPMALLGLLLVLHLGLQAHG
eukprot:9469805-Pyramimonas_sp.AAC.2